MNYLRDKDSIFTSKRGAKKNTRNFFLVSIFVGFSVYIIFFTGIFGILERSVGSVAAPMLRVQQSAIKYWNDIYSIFISKKYLLEKNKELEEEIMENKAKLLDRDLLLEENTELKKILGRDPSSQTVLALVIAKPNRTLYDTLIIDVGEDKGVQKGDQILYAGDIVIGKVAEVFKESSKVLLFSSPGEEIDVVVGPDLVTITATGRGNGNFELKLPRDIDVSLEDAVSVAGTSLRILGTVKSIEESPSDPFKTVFVAGPVDIFKLRWLEVDIK